MRFIRPFEGADFADTAFKGYRNIFAAYLESVTVVGARVAVGGCGPDLHYHESDQFYFILQGETNVQLGTDRHVAPAGSLVFVPAGVAHRNWNDGDVEEMHFEMIVPTIRPGRPLLIFVDTPADAPGSDVAPYVQALDGSAFAESKRFAGFGLQCLADASSGVTSCIVNAAQVAPGKAGPGTHIHDFDQLYFVLSGELHVEVALQHHVATKHTLVVLPAGVPHRQWNEGPDPERHLAVLVPAPSPERPWDSAVSFAATSVKP